MMLGAIVAAMVGVVIYLHDKDAGHQEPTKAVAMSDEMCGMGGGDFQVMARADKHACLYAALRKSR